MPGLVAWHPNMKSALLSSTQTSLLKLVWISVVGLSLAHDLPADDKLLGLSAVSGNVGRIQRWTQFIGKEPGYITDTIPSDDWATLTDYGLKFFINSHAKIPRKERYEIGLPMFPTKDDAGALMADNAARWSEGASGKYNAKFRGIAEDLVKAGFGHASIRLGWEFNGNWFAWGLDHGDAAHRPDRARAFRECWRQIHAAMMSVPGAEFRWVWNASVGYEPEGFDPALAYPGDQWVDCVSVDIYDAHGEYYWTWWKAPDNHWPLDTLRDWAWKALVEGVHTNLETGLPDGKKTRGMNDYREFARKHGKLFVISEWGIWDQEVIVSLNPPKHLDSNGPWGSGDNPMFIQRMYDWIKANDVHAAAYFGVRNPELPLDHSLTDEGLGMTTNPLSRKRFLETFVKSDKDSIPSNSPAKPIPHSTPAADALHEGACGLEELRRHARNELN